MKLRKLLALLFLITAFVAACAANTTTTVDSNSPDPANPANFTTRAESQSELVKLGEKPEDYLTPEEKHNTGIWIDEKLKIGMSAITLATRKSSKGTIATELITSTIEALTLPISVTEKSETYITIDSNSAKSTTTMRCDIQEVNNGKLMSCPVLSTEPAEMDKVFVAYSFVEMCYVKTIETVTKNETYGVFAINGRSFKAKKVHIVTKGGISCSRDERGIGYQIVTRIFAIDLPVMFPSTHRHGDIGQEAYNYTEYKLSSGEVLNTMLFETLQFKE